jgi:HSP20 family protein
MKALLPQSSLTSFRKEMDRLFDRFWDGETLELTGSGEWSPSMDFSETKDAFTVKVEVPGISPEDIQVGIRSGVLTIKGEKKEEVERKDERFYRMERAHGMFTRNVRLPAAVDETKVNATFSNGVLTILLPKTAEAKGTTVPIKIA